MALNVYPTRLTREPCSSCNPKHRQSMGTQRGTNIGKRLIKQDVATLHQYRGVASTERMRKTNTTWAGIRQPWTADSALLGLISVA